MTPTGLTRMKKRTDEMLVALCLLLAGFAALALAAYPVYVIRPFREQGSRELKSALWVLLHNRPIVLVIAVLIVAATILVWKRSGWVARVVLVPATILGILGAVATWINPEELMFHPFGAPKYVAANLAQVDAKDMVIVVTLGNESRAYPIREMGYHHIVNDRLHGLPIVVTY